MTKRLSLILTLAILYLFAGQGLYAQDRVDTIRKELLNPRTDKVLVVAHRAYWHCNAPENSLAAIDSAINLKVDIVELDVWRTKDHHLVLMHDATVDRTTNGKGKIADLTLAEIKQLRLKDKNGNLTSHRVPTLRETLIRIKGKIMVNLDKAFGYFDEIYPLLEETGTTDHILMKSDASPAEVQQKFGAYLDKVLYMPIVSMNGANANKLIADYMEALHPVAFEITFSKGKEPACIQLKEQLKGKCLPWYNSMWAGLSGEYTDAAAMNDPDAVYGYLVNQLGARLIQTDRPAELIGYLRRLGRHE